MNGTPATPPVVRQQAAAIEQMLARGQVSAALEAAHEACRQHPADDELRLLLAHALCRSGRACEALLLAEELITAHSTNPAPRMLAVDALLQLGDNHGAQDALRGLERHCAGGDPRLLQDMAAAWTALGCHQDAEACHARARALVPNDPAAVYNHATSLMAMGELERAEQALDRVIELAPHDADAWYNRATLRRQTAARNHVDAIEQQLARTAANAPARVPLYYAMAKELEDLDRYEDSFAALQQGASARRAQLSYRVEDDVATLDLIGQAFDPAWLAAARPGHTDARPVFIVGLPRSGTTLVDRILSSHTAVHSRGETPDLPMAVMAEAGPARNKAELVERSRAADPAALGRRYCAHLPTHGTQRQIDKTPANFLYLGLVAAALPQAKIIHVRRQPMDVCYAMYKTLFRMAYPFSYALEDLGAYWLAWQRLMAHWRRMLPATQYLEVDYEDLVTRQEAVSRRLVAHLGLPWEDACLAFERNPEPSLTASVAQVRQPIYRSSVGRWRHYRQQLAPLAELLTTAGIDLDAPWESPV